MGSLGMHAMADTRRDNLSSNINFAWRDSRVEIWVPQVRSLLPFGILESYERELLHTGP